MDDAPLFNRIYFEMLDIVAAIYQDATHERIAKPLGPALNDSLESFIQSKLSMMRLDIDRSKILRRQLGVFKEFLINDAVPQRLTTLSHIAHKNKIVKLSDELKISIVKDINESQNPPESRPLSIDIIRRSNRQIISIISLQKLVIQDKINEIADLRPNDPDQIAFKNDQIIFLEKVRESLDAVVNIKTEAKPTLEAVGILEAFITWWNQHNQKVVGWSVSVPAAAVGIGILQLAGVPVTYSVAAMTALAGGRKLPDIIRELRDK